jgi:hypothetical protein
VWMIHEVRLAWDVPAHGTPSVSGYCGSRCGTITNSDWTQHTVTVSQDGHRLSATIVPHGKVSVECSYMDDCIVELGAKRIPIELNTAANVVIEHGTLVGR